MSNITLLTSALLYLSLLFWIAYRAEKKSRQGKSLVNNPYIYALSLAVYCTAWTFYGSVGRATSDGIEFLAVYIGPTLTAPLWWLMLRKIIRICKVQRITSIADFVSARYGKNRTLGVLVTLLSVMGIIPYISIQLKAVSGSVAVLSGGAENGQTGLGNDQSLLITLFLAAFTILFGARKLEATERHEGLVTAIAFESIVKLVAFVAVGAYVTFGLFDGPADIFAKAETVPALRSQFTFGPGHSTADWFWYSILSAMAVIFLPRQFQVAVVENVNERHLDKAMWLFPMYLFLINLFVFTLAFGGKLLLGNQVNADTYVLSLPLMAGKKELALLAYIGGFSAATSMIIVETTALSVMISNNVVMPLVVSFPRLQRQFGPGSSVFVINTRRLAILILLLLAYLYYRHVADYFSLVSVGMISFAAVVQFAPAILGGIYWKRGTEFGAVTGLVAGMVIWLYTLIVPTLVPVGFLPESLMQEGPFGIELLKPNALLGLTSLSPISHAVFWSLLVNTALYIWGSLCRPQRSLDHNQAVLFVDVFQYQTSMESSVVWKGKALVTDVRALLARFFGDDRANRLIERYVRRNQLNVAQPYADPRLVTYSEKLLAGAIGTASARILVASVANEEQISIDEVIRILKTSQELLAVNKELKRKSLELEQLTQQLSEANHRLKVADQQKDDFLSTVTHEIRTPITSVRALSEILHDTPDMDYATRQHFLETIIKESERLTRLINQVLDLERIESGRYKLTRELVSMTDIVQDSVDAVAQLAAEKKIDLRVSMDNLPMMVTADRDRMQQVIINLISNAIKFTPADSGRIIVEAGQADGQCIVSIADNGRGIDPAQHELIFEKFYQAHDKAVRKPKGSGLGLAISKKIIELHHGSITVDSAPGLGSTFTFVLPMSEGAAE